MIFFSIDYLLLSHDKTGPEWIVNLAKGLNDEPQWQSSDDRIHKLALIMDDGFEAATTSPQSFNEHGVPDGVEVTPRPWMHEMITSQIDALADNAQNTNTGGIDLSPEKLNLKTQNNSGEIQFRLDSAMLQRVQNASGIFPIIVGMRQLESLSAFLGNQ